MTARTALPFNHPATVTRQSVDLPRPVGAFVPVAWRVIVLLRAMPAPGGEVRPVTAFVGPIDQARTALEIVTDRVGPAALVYIVNEEAAKPNERSARWEHAGWCLRQIRGRIISRVISEVGVRPETDWGTAPEFCFTMPYALALRVGAYHLRGSLHLAEPLTTIYSRSREAMLIDRARIIENLACEEGAL